MLNLKLIDVDSEDDQSYEPDIPQETPSRSPKIKSSFDPLAQFISLNKVLAEKGELRGSQEQPLAMARRVLQVRECKMRKVVTFAGREYIMNEDGQIRQEQDKQRQAIQLSEEEKFKASYAKANHLIAKLMTGSKKINSIVKSKFDWQKYVREEGFEDKLKYNRKGGAVPKALIGGL